LASADRGFELRVRLTPKAGADRIDGPETGAGGEVWLKARVRAIPENGAANAALEAMLAKALGAPKSAVRVVRGPHARVKTVRIDAGPEALTIAKRWFEGEGE